MWYNVNAENRLDKNVKRSSKIWQNTQNSSYVSRVHFVLECVCVCVCVCVC